MTITFLFLLLGLICFVLGAIGVVIPRINWIALGLAFVTIAAMLGSGLRL